MDDVIQENRKSYSSKLELPIAYRDNFSINVLKLLIGDLMHKFGKNPTFCTQCAEIEFYYYANYYNALKLLVNIESERPSIFIMQRVYNLKRVIMIGLKKNEEDEKKDGILSSIEYLGVFKKLLEKMEEAYDLTRKFWNTLLEPFPTAEVLNDLGKNLCKSKFRILQLSHSISDINSNHCEFLLRFGIFMKFFMHDKSTLEHLFQKIVTLYEGSCFNSFNNYNFSLFRPDVSVILILASIENLSTASIKDVNSAIEGELGYERNELIGNSINCLMSSNIALHHSDYMIKFFKTMETHSIGIERFRFLKKKNGIFTGCHTLKLIVPRLSNGLQIALFLYVDPDIKLYSSGRKVKTSSKVLFFILNTNYLIRLEQLYAMKIFRLQDLLKKL